MDWMKNRKTARLIAIVVVLLATLWGAHRSLNTAAAKISDQFYNGVGATETQVSAIENQLTVRCNAGNNLLSYAYPYREEMLEYGEFREAWLALSEALAEKVGPEALFDANEIFQEKADALYHALLSRDLSVSDSLAIEDEYTRMKNAGIVVARSGYNDAVRSFKREQLSAFPANILHRLLPVSVPELFE